MRTSINILLLLFITKLSFCQQLTSLDCVLDYTSKEEFIAHKIFNIASQNFSKDGSLIVNIRGDFKSSEFSIVIVSALPALQKVKTKKNLVLGYKRLNEENLQEALLIESIRLLYPNLFFDYLLTRSICLFENHESSVLTDMGIDIDSLQTLTIRTDFISKVKSMFSSGVESELSFSVNDIEFKLLKDFYIGMNSSLCSMLSTINQKCDFMYCISNTLHNDIQIKIKSGILEPLDIKNMEFIYDQQDIYIAIIAATSLDKSIYTMAKKLLYEPIDLLAFSLRRVDYEILASNVEGDFFKYNIKYCRETPCKHLYEY